MTFLATSLVYLHYIVPLVPLGDEEQLGQTLWVALPDVVAELPQEILLVLKELRVVFVVHYFLQLNKLWEKDATKQHVGSRVTSRNALPGTVDSCCL